MNHTKRRRKRVTCVKKEKEVLLGKTSWNLKDQILETLEDDSSRDVSIEGIGQEKPLREHCGFRGKIVVVRFLPVPNYKIHDKVLIGLTPRITNVDKQMSLPP